MSKVIIGVDEVGAGPLAGPLYVCALAILKDKEKIPKVKDSKKLSKEARKRLKPLIEKVAISSTFSTIEPDEIDRINIIKARKKAMEIAINKTLKDLKSSGWKLQDIEIKVDGNDLKLEIEDDLEIKYIIKGDQTEYAISCASILAKVARDDFMDSISNKYPQYNFKKNKGYGTKEHINAIKKIGISAVHRKTFCKNFIKF